jgi:hypothetical protein
MPGIEATQASALAPVTVPQPADATRPPIAPSDTPKPTVPPAVTPTPEYGLLVEDHKVELQRVQVDVLLLDLCADVRVRQMFKVHATRTPQPELTSADHHQPLLRLGFSFPINDTKAGVYHFSARLGSDKVITIKVVEKDDGGSGAAEDLGHRGGAASGRQTTRRDRFEVDLGRHLLPWPAGEGEVEVEVEVELRYMMEIKMATSSLFRIESAQDMAKAQAKRDELGNRFKFVFPALFSSPLFCAAESSFALHVDVEAASPIVSLESFTHPQLAGTLNATGSSTCVFPMRASRSRLPSD